MPPRFYHFIRFLVPAFNFFGYSIDELQFCDIVWLFFIIVLATANLSPCLCLCLPGLFW